MLLVRELSRVYGGRVAVDRLSFRIRPGEVVGLVGPNGAGKTTTMRVIAGILAPSAGGVEVEGRDVVRSPIEAKSAVAFVADDPALFPQLTVWEHLELVAGLYRVTGWEDRGRSLLADLQIGDRRDSLADELSRGMRQKVAVACALLHRPRLWMLDEPLSGLDPRGIRTLFDAIARHAAEGGAVLLSSHLLSQIERACSRFVILAAGRLVLEGSPDELRARLPDLRGDASLEEIFFQATEAPEPPAPGTA